MPYRPTPDPDAYDADCDRIPWDEWGPQEQERLLREALGWDLYDWIGNRTLWRKQLDTRPAICV